MREVKAVRREYPESPIIGVGGIVLLDDRVLIAKRAREPGKGTWTLPGGMVELGESLEEALRREIMEELSLSIRIRGLVKLVDKIVRDKEDRIRYHYVIADYLVYPLSGKVQPGSDISDAKYVPLKDVHAMGLNPEVVETILLADGMRRGEPGLRRNHVPA
ncbi:MAG: NUDIX domain-containing protein [Desulfobacteraceae bacterium]|nr:MAG: NUDIX domain-containing protein [Desulfobacteraceae bacterium]